MVSQQKALRKSDFREIGTTHVRVWDGPGPDRAAIFIGHRAEAGARSLKKSPEAPARAVRPRPRGREVKGMGTATATATASCLSGSRGRGRGRLVGRAGSHPKPSFMKPHFSYFPPFFPYLCFLLRPSTSHRPANRWARGTHFFFLFLAPFFDDFLPFMSLGPFVFLLDAPPPAGPIEVPSSQSSSSSCLSSSDDAVVLLG